MTSDAIRTYTGRSFWPLTPQEEDISSLDIAHALSNLCRFGGHVREFYSVAQHSVLVAELIEQVTGNLTAAFVGLLHDASEAYLIDIPRPLKLMPVFAPYRAAEEKLQSMIYRHFGLLEAAAEPEMEWLHAADMQVCYAEIRDLMRGDQSCVVLARDHPHITPLQPAMAEMGFHRAFDRLSLHTQPQRSVLA